MGNKAEDEQYDRERQSFAQQIENGATLERIADSLERLVIAADSIATALALNAMVTRRIANQNERASTTPELETDWPHGFRGESDG